MKTFVILGIAALSLGSIYAADPQTDATPQPSAMPEARKPLPPLDSGPPPGRPHNKKPDWKGKGAGKETRPPGQGRHDFAPRPQGRQRPDFGHGSQEEEKPKFGHGEMLAKALNLTSEQKEKAKSIMEATKPKLEAIREEGRAKAKAVIQDALKELRPILTPEQQAVLDDLQKLRVDRAALESSGKPEKAADSQNKSE